MSPTQTTCTNQKNMPKESSWQGTSSHSRSQKPWNKETQFPTKKLKAVNMLKQRRDNFQFGGKHKLNLKLTVFFYLT